MTAEERAVIEAAERVIDWWGKPCISSEGNALSEAVRALRESRKPKPRYYISFGTGIIDRETSTRIAEAGDHDMAERIVLLLNRANERGEP